MKKFQSDSSLLASTMRVNHLSLFCAFFNLCHAFKSDLAALAVLGGGNTAGDVLVIPINTTRACQSLPRVSQPADGEGSVAAVIAGKITVCGGDYSQDCVQYDRGLGKWENAAEMDMFRPFADGAKVDDDRLWITGGGVVGRDSNPTDTTIIYQAGTIQRGPSLPYETNRHCVVKVNATHFLLTGGLNTHGDWNIERRDAYLLEWNTQRWTRLRNMRRSRMGHGCGMLGERKVIVVGNGFSRQYEGSSEILDLDTLRWTPGPTLPTRMESPQVVENGDAVIVVGASGPLDPRWRTFEFGPLGEKAEAWREREENAERFDSKWGRVEPVVIGLADKEMPC